MAMCESLASVYLWPLGECRCAPVTWCIVTVTECCRFACTQSFFFRDWPRRLRELEESSVVGHVRPTSLRVGSQRTLAQW